MKRILLTTIGSIVFLTGTLQAQMLTSENGMKKIKSNLSAATANKQMYDKNLQIVHGNIQEIDRAVNFSQKQKSQVDAEMAKNKESVKNVLNQEKDITLLIMKEKDTLASEDKQIQQLQALIEQIKKNQEVRKANLADYQNQLELTVSRKNDWLTREAHLKAQQEQIKENLKTLQTQNQNMQNKKSEFAAEQKRWMAESKRTQNISDTYQGIAEGK